MGDRRGFDEVVRADPATETATGAVKMKDDLFRWDAEDPIDHAGADGRNLGRRPDFHHAVFPVGGGILRLEVGVRNERINIICFDDFGGSA